MFSEYKVDDNSCEVGLLQYADDAIFVGEVNSRNAFTIKVILRDFELVKLWWCYRGTKLGGGKICGLVVLSYAFLFLLYTWASL